MKKRSFLFLAVMLCMFILIAPLSANGAEKCSMVLTYSKENAVFSGLDIKIYRVADADLNKLSPFESYPVQVKGITSQSEWSDTAVTLRSYIVADSIEPYMSAETDAEGTVTFSGIEKGLYLVCGVRAEADSRHFIFYDFMINVSENVTAKPKSGISEPTGGETTYSIIKLWKNDDLHSRPLSVTVDILKDGELHETVILDHINNWSYSFKSDSDSVWSVAERNVPEDYFVLITEKAATFIITNTGYDENPDDGTPGKDTTAVTGTGSDTTGPDYDPPQTGDTFPMKRYMLMLCISGMMLVILGFGMRRKDDAKSR